MIQPKYAANLTEGFQSMSEEDKEITLKRIREINGVEPDADINSNIASFILQDMLFAVVDDVYKTQHVLSELQTSGIPKSVIEANNITPEYQEAFRKGTAFAAQVVENLLINAEVVQYFVDVVNHTDIEEEQK